MTKASTGLFAGAEGHLRMCRHQRNPRTIATHESRAEDTYKKMVLEAGSKDIISTDRINGNSANWLADSIKDFKKKPEARSKRTRDYLSAGISVAMVEKIKSTGEAIREMVGKYNQVCQKLMGIYKVFLKISREPVE